RFQFWGIAMSIIAIAATVGLARHRQMSRLETANAGLRRQIDGGAAAPCQSAVAAAQQDGKLSELADLEKLVADQSAEIEQLHSEIAAAAPKPLPSNLPFSMLTTRIPKDAWTFAGYDTPEHALESMLWAARDGNAQVLRDSLTINARGNANSDDTERAEELLTNVTDLQILKYEVQDNSNRIHLTVYFDGLEQKDQPLWIDAQRLGDQWKLDSMLRQH